MLVLVRKALMPTANSHHSKSPRGNHAGPGKGGRQEAAMRMLMTPRPQGREPSPDDLVVYGGIGKAGRATGIVRPHVPHRWRPPGTTKRCGAIPQGRSRSLSDSSPRRAEVLIATRALAAVATWEISRDISKAGLTEVRR